MSEELVTAILEMQGNEALRLVQEALDRGEDPKSVLEFCQEGLRIVGQRYEKGEYFLPELVMSGTIISKIFAIVKPKLATQDSSKGESDSKTKVVLGTVRGDIHNIGKDIVGFMLDVNGFEVHDLGVNVPEEKFVEAVKEVKPRVVAMSGLLTLVNDVMKSTVEALEKAGLRNKVKIMIGGGQINEMVKDYVKADGYGTSAWMAVRLAKEWDVGEKA